MRAPLCFLCRLGVSKQTCPVRCKNSLWVCSRVKKKKIVLANLSQYNRTWQIHDLIRPFRDQRGDGGLRLAFKSIFEETEGSETILLVAPSFSSHLLTYITHLLTQQILMEHYQWPRNYAGWWKNISEQFRKMSLVVLTFLCWVSRGQTIHRCIKMENNFS